MASNFKDGIINQLCMKHSVIKDGVSTSTVQLENVFAALSFVFLGRQFGSLIRRKATKNENPKVLLGQTKLHASLDAAPLGSNWKAISRSANGNA